MTRPDYLPRNTPSIFSVFALAFEYDHWDSACGYRMTDKEREFFRHIVLPASVTTAAAGTVAAAADVPTS